MNIGMSGKYTIRRQKILMKDGIAVLDSKGEQIRIGSTEVIAEFDNLITNAGLDKMGTADPILHMHLSSDTSEPTVNDNSVQSLLGTSSTKTGLAYGSSSTITPPFYNSRVVTFKFAAGVSTGNISKIYVGWTSNGSNGIWSTALVKGGDGLVTSITKLADEILDVTYEVRTYLPSSDALSVVSISGVDYNVTTRLGNLKNSWIGNEGLLLNRGLDFAILTGEGALGDVYNMPTSTKGEAVVSVTRSGYVSGSYQHVYVISCSLGQANFVGGVRFGSLSIYGNTNVWQFRFSKISDGTAIMKTSDYTLVLPPLVISWGRYVAT